MDIDGAKSKEAEKHAAKEATTKVPAAVSRTGAGLALQPPGVLEKSRSKMSSHRLLAPDVAGPERSVVV